MASNREALRKFTRKFPPPPEVADLLLKLQLDSPMAAAITGAALADAALEQLLKSKFTSKDQNLIGRIFLNRGPLSDFDSKILVAQAFGIITSRIAGELHCIKAIRNAFAHSRQPLAFDHELIDREMRAMNIPNTIASGKFEEAKGIKFTNQDWYLLTISILTIMLDQMGKTEKSGDAALRDALRE